jgi:hypothetical protein
VFLPRLRIPFKAKKKMVRKFSQFYGKTMMKRLLLAVVLISSFTLPLTAEAGLIRDAGRSCVFGAALLATTTYFGLTPTLLARGPASALRIASFSSPIASNAVVGCGVTAAASTAASVFTWLYDSLF